MLETSYVVLQHARMSSQSLKDLLLTTRDLEIIDVRGGTALVRMAEKVRTRLQEEHPELVIERDLRYEGLATVVNGRP